MKKKKVKCVHIYGQVKWRRNLVNYQVALHAVYREQTRRHLDNYEIALYTRHSV